MLHRLWSGRRQPSVEPAAGVLPPTTISASAVGDYLYCARAYRLRQLGQQSSDPVAAMLAAQGVSDSRRALAGDRAAQAELRRRATLTIGIQAHRRHDRLLGLATSLRPAGLLLLALALVCGLLALLLR